MHAACYSGAYLVAAALALTAATRSQSVYLTASPLLFKTAPWPGIHSKFRLLLPFGARIPLLLSLRGGNDVEQGKAGRKERADEADADENEVALVLERTEDFAARAAQQNAVLALNHFVRVPMATARVFVRVLIWAGSKCTRAYVCNVACTSTYTGLHGFLTSKRHSM